MSLDAGPRGILEITDTPQSTSEPLVDACLPPNNVLQPTRSAALHVRLNPTVWRSLVGRFMQIMKSLYNVSGSCWDCSLLRFC
jgi:hypothetical protein